MSFKYTSILLFYIKNRPSFDNKIAFKALKHDNHNVIVAFINIIFCLSFVMLATTMGRLLGLKVGNIKCLSQGQ